MGMKGVKEEGGEEVKLKKQETEKKTKVGRN